ncbi:DUF6114 domain-containing protein [Thermomonospora umbrina]|uniref:Uncharacterized protein n=1 Tax=Thermomonospora umbrina TaxID=111806 RepID=A0A3D9T2H0_9ACTN|nr:DUF6114 domain-containing protein [Thermomonospora umbrina]REF01041.1 hypothetical protein DFJ69_6639 [Thermomonospora umbrina]
MPTLLPNPRKTLSSLRGAPRAFKAFRRSRPFWGAMWLALSGYIILQLSWSPVTVVIKSGIGGVSSYVIGFGMLVFAFFALFVPSQRHLAGLLGVAFALASLVLSNLGGFIVGMLCGIIGGAMVFAWAPHTEKQLAKKRARRDRRAAKKKKNGVAHA